MSWFWSGTIAATCSVLGILAGYGVGRLLGREKSGGGAARVEKRGETVMSNEKSASFESLNSGSTVRIRIITAQVDFF